jgi:hypothetical protein
MTHRCSIVVQTCGVKVLPASFLEGPPFVKQKSARTVQKTKISGKKNPDSEEITISDR